MFPDLAQYVGVFVVCIPDQLAVCITKPVLPHFAFQKAQLAYQVVAVFGFIVMGIHTNKICELLVGSVIWGRSGTYPETSFRSRAFFFL